MEYKEKYEHGLECIQEILSGAGDSIKTSILRKRLQPFFPELKENENEDERTRKEIIDFLELPHAQFIGKRDHKKWIAWLEKQGEQKHFSDFKAEDWYVSKVDGKIHNMTYNPTDKVEPKFKVGDWIVFNGSILHIDEVVNGYYRTTSIGDGIHNSYDWDIDNAARLWTIQEAKDGDILVCNINKAEIGGDIEKLPNMTPTICIYQNVVKDSDYIHSYCSLYDENSLVLQNTMYYNAFVCNIHPATKGQRDLLFQKMKEEGCEWDSEKKELKKIEPKTLDVWNAEDEQNLNVVLSYIDDEYLRKWLKDIIQSMQQ